MLRALPLAVVLVAWLQPSSFDTRWSRVAAFFRDRVSDAGIVGGSLMFVRDGAVAAAVFQGLQDRDAKRPVDEDTIYHWASITKMFTGVAVMQLRDRGLLSLDDPIVKHIPELRTVHGGNADVSKVTIRHLMSHSAGFRAATWPWGGDRPWHPFEPTRWDQLVAMLPYTELLFEPGTRYSYSNPGVIFLGRVVEQLSGDDYEVYVAKNIFMPLGMSRSFFDRAPYHLLAHRSHSYARGDTGLREQPFDFDTGITVSNGGLNAPLGDMARWLAFLIGEHGGDAGRARDDRVLKRTSVEEMFIPQLRARDGEGGSGGDVQAGLSCFVERHGGLDLVGHSGDQNGFIAHLYLHRPSRAGYIVAFNTNAASTSDPRRSTKAVDNELRDLIVRELFEGAGR